MKFIKKIKYSLIKDRESVILFDLFGFYPNNPKLYKQSFIHKSYPIETPQGTVNNERLEYLGDAILTAVISSILYKYFPLKDEGFLSKVRANIISRKSLNKLAVDIGLEKFIIKKEKVPLGNIQGNVFEALIGAIYLDKGYRFCHTFVEKEILSQHINIDKVAVENPNFKSQLIEWSQQNKKMIKFLTVSVDESGTPNFQTQVFLDNVNIAQATSRTKKESQQQAAKVALTYMDME